MKTIGLVAVTALLAGAGLLWWLLVNSGPVTAEEIVRGSCSKTLDLHSYDITTTITLEHQIWVHSFRMSGSDFYGDIALSTGKDSLAARLRID